MTADKGEANQLALETGQTEKARDTSLGPF